MNLALLVGIVATSVVGSVHCVAMCGPLVGRHPGAHALGRLVTYVALGATAGAVGSAIDLAGKMAHVQRVAAVMAAIVIVIVGIQQVTGSRLPAAGNFGKALVRIRTSKPRRRAWLMGILTGLIPCGWLWAFVVSAGGTGHVWTGAAVMAAFWLGTVPAMVGLLTFAGPWLAKLRARMPAVTAAVMIALALGTLAMRWHDAGSTRCLLCEGVSL